MSGYSVLLDFHLLASCSPLGASVLLSLESLADRVRSHFEECHHAHGVDEIMEALRRTNEFVQEERPWELRKGDSDRGGPIPQNREWRIIS